MTTKDKFDQIPIQHTSFSNKMGVMMLRYSVWKLTLFLSIFLL